LEDLILGIHVHPEGLNFDEMKTICTESERLGFDLFTVTDHFLNMAQPDGPKKHPLECWSTLAGLAAVTSKIRLGSLVSCYYYRLPTVLAKMATTVDIISKGRLIFGIGAGWFQNEFESFVGQFPSVRERMIGLDETIQICSSMFKNERTSFKGKIFHFENVLNSPLPVQRSPPILVGGGGIRRTLRIAAKYADISHCAFNPSETVLDHKLDALRKHCEFLKRDFDEIRKGIGLAPVIGLTRDEIETKTKQRAQSVGIAIDEYRKRIGPSSGTPERCIEAMKKYIEKGITLFTLEFPNLDEAKLFANEIMPQLR
jgi:F420-dependent oxidoreductase-like protein